MNLEVNVEQLITKINSKELPLLIGPLTPTLLLNDRFYRFVQNVFDANDHHSIFKFLLSFPKNIVHELKRSFHLDNQLERIAFVRLLARLGSLFLASLQSFVENLRDLASPDMSLFYATLLVSCENYPDEILELFSRPSFRNNIFIMYSALEKLMELNSLGELILRLLLLKVSLGGS